MTREEAIYRLKNMAWLYGSAEREQNIEAINMAIKALQGDMYCPNCGVRLVTENEYLEPTQTHGRLIDADALMRSAVEKFYTTNLFNHISKMIEDAPTVQADRPHGEWYNRDSDGTWATVDFAYCSECKQPIIHKHASPLWYFCPNCGADMRKEKK